jgi:hypothetical protein
MALRPFNTGEYNFWMDIDDKFVYHVFYALSREKNYGQIRSLKSTQRKT